MAADVLLGGRSYVQTRFLATEDSSTLTPLVRLFVFKNILSPKTIIQRLQEEEVYSERFERRSVKTEAGQNAAHQKLVRMQLIYSERNCTIAARRKDSLHTTP